MNRFCISERIIKYCTTSVYSLLLMGYFIPDLNSQQAPRYSQYMMNEFIINPAMAGLDGRTILNLTGRKEWVGFGEGVPTPQTCSASIQSRLLKRDISKKLKASGNKYASVHKGKVGLGAAFISDFNGAIMRQSIGLTYAYHIFVEGGQLSFGLTGAFTQLNVRGNYLYFEDNNDLFRDLSTGSIWIPDFAVGINIKYPGFQAGLAVTQLLESTMILGNTMENGLSTDTRFRRHYYFLSSYHHEFNHNPNWEYEPSLLVKSGDLFGSDPKSQADIVLRLIYDKNFWFGAGYRTSNEYIVLAGFCYNPFNITYSFDYGPNQISRYSYGSHEISVSVKLGNQLIRYNCINYKKDRKKSRKPY